METCTAIGCVFQTWFFLKIFNFTVHNKQTFEPLAPDFLIRRPEYKRETWNDLLMFREKIEELNLL